MRSLFLLLSLCVVWLSPAAAQVSPEVVTDHARTRLVAERVSTAPGSTISLAVVQELEPHWHVYWKNPGDSGLPLDLRWDLPDGFEAGEVKYPLPHMLPLGPLTNYGHEGSPTFLIELTVPQTAEVGTVANIRVDANWLICYDICVPEQGSFRLFLPITEDPGVVVEGYQERFAAARAEQPQPASFESAYFHIDRGPVLAVTDAPSGTYEFYPYAPALIEPSKDVLRGKEGTTDYFGFKSGFAYDASKPERFGGLLVVENDQGRVGYELFAPMTDAPDPMPALGDEVVVDALPAAASPGETLLLPKLVLAFLGGIILNIMPCVFPIVFMKAAGFAGMAREGRGEIRLHGLLYTGGILAAFVALSGALMLLRAGGEQLGWGFHLQSPFAVGLFAVLIFLIGLNFAGVFELGSSLQGMGDRAPRQGRTGAFMTGLLAVAVAAPCIGPFLGGAIGLALTQSAVSGLMIFMMIGLGLAFPYLLLSFIPAAARALPKPGPWMVTLRQLFSFALFGTAVWLAWVLSVQSGSAGVLRLGIALVLAGMAAWLWGRSQEKGTSLSRIFSLAALLGAIYPLIGVKAEAQAVIESEAPDQLPTVIYSEARLEELRTEQVPVFVDFTAAWCITCQVNKKTVLETRPVIEAFHRAGAKYMVADWTVQDPEITKALEAQGRAGVPLYLYYAPGAGQPEILPQMLSTDRVISLFDEDKGA